MNLKKMYYSMPRKRFDSYLYQLKNDASTIRLFSKMKNDYFFHLDEKSLSLILELHKQQMQFDQFVSSASMRKKEFIVESLIIDEIKTTNATENIYSTRKDIFGLMNQVTSIKDKKVKSILQAYKSIENPELMICDLQSIRTVYDVMMKGAFDSREDIPDGEFFRKGQVNVSNGIKSVHKGFYPESEIILGMEEFLAVYKNQKIDIYMRLILSHFMFETIHPYYDGNGRLGRLLFSMELLNAENSVSAYLISSSINRNKKSYYAALENGRDYYSFGCLNTYLTQMVEIFIEGFKDVYLQLCHSEQECQRLIEESRQMKMTKSERKIYDYLIEASCFSYYGTTNDKIISNCGVSKRTVVTTIGKWRENKMLEDTKIGAFEYHKIKTLTNNRVD